MFGLLTVVAQLTGQVPMGGTPQFENASEMLSSADYPEGAILLGQEGTVGVLLTIGTNGRATGCTIEQSSGFVALDSQTCSLLSSRARFAPARDRRGVPTVGTYSQRIIWRLSDNALPVQPWTMRLLVALNERGVPELCNFQVGGAVRKKRASFMAECSHLSGAFTIPVELARLYPGRKPVVIFDQQFVPKVVDSINTPRDLTRYLLLSRNVIHFQIDRQGSISSCRGTKSEGSFTPALDGCQAMLSRKFRTDSRRGAALPATATTAIYVYVK